MKKWQILAIIAALVAGLGWATIHEGSWSNAARPICDVITLSQSADEADARGKTVTAGLYKQWAEKCQLAKEGNLPPTASPSASTASPSTLSSTTATASQSTLPMTGVEEFLANRPANTKTSINAYGPKTAILPELNNKGMENLSPNEAKAELIYVSEVVDKMQTADKAIDLGIVAKNGDKNQVNKLTERFVNDHSYWNEIRKQTGNRLRELIPSIETVNPGTVVGMSYSVPGPIPQIGNKDVSFNYPTKWLTLKDAKGNVVVKYRLLCHFQHGGVGQDLPKPPPGTDITPEGEPVVLADACRQINGDWVKRYGVVPRQGDLSVNSPKCNTPSNPPSEKPSNPPSEKPSNPPSEKPTPEPKDPSKDPNAQGNAGNGGGKNQDSGPGAVTVPTHAPEAPRVNPPAPKPAPEPTKVQETSAPEPTKVQPAPAPEAAAPAATSPATGCAPAPGETTC